MRPGRGGTTGSTGLSNRLTMVPAALIVAGFLPLCILQARSLWNRPNLRAFPIALLAGLVLAVVAARRLGTLSTGSRRLSLLGVGMGGTMLILAAISAWPWLGTASALWMVLTGVYAVGGWRFVRAVLPAWGFTALAVLPPTLADQLLIERLQALATPCASRVLDALGVLHVVEGNVIRIEGRRLMVEEACSGVSSLFAILGVTLFVAIWSRRSLIATAILVAAASTWVIVGNIVRITTVAFAADRGKLDMSAGLSHEALGLFIFAAVLALTVSTDHLAKFVGAFRSMRWVVPFNWDGQDMPPLQAVEVSPPLAFPRFDGTWLASWPMAIGFASFGIIQVAWLWPALSGAFSPDPVVAALNRLGEDDLPEHLGPYTHREFFAEQRSPDSAFGEFSRAWRYKTDRRTAVASIDYPFRGWHELTSCYRGIGWTVRRRVVQPGGGPDGTGAFVETELTRPPGRQMALLFGLDDMFGDSLEPREPSTWLGYLGHRFAILRSSRARTRTRGRSQYYSTPPAYQVQLLIETDGTNSREREAEDRALFEQVRRQVRRRVEAATERIAKRDGS